MFNTFNRYAQRTAERRHAQAAKRYDPRATMERLYGHPTDIDKVWQDRDALHDAERSMTGEKQ